jgi:drug/metabolite transporter (DMT)-like permease
LRKWFRFIEQNRTSQNFPASRVLAAFTFMTRSTMTFRRYLVLAFVSVSAPLGDTFLDVGMKRIGPVSLSDVTTLFHAVSTPWIAGGIVLLIGFFASYLTALSWADLTFVLPATSLGNVVVALLARFWRHEQISLSRWAGIFLITAAVGFVTQGPSYTEHEKPAIAQDVEEVCHP